MEFKECYNIVFDVLNVCVLINFEFIMSFINDD